jgi:hypothetical protein
VLLVGSVPLDSPEAVFRLVGETVGGLVSGVPDGEPGYRQQWINMLAACIYSQTPWLETDTRPRGTPAGEDWHPTEYDDHWMFKVKKGAGPYRLEQLGYADDAKRSYATLRSLRGAGVIPPGVRFQVSLPATESATRWFTTSAEDYAILYDAYDEAMTRELAAICQGIPADDLLIQWDICMETLSIESNDQRRGLTSWKTPGEPFERYRRAIASLSRKVPEAVPMGLHLCYGDLYHKHLVEPKDLGVCVRMANAAAREAGRPIDFVHVPVPRDRHDDAYFAPLKDLDVGDGRLFLGLVHTTGGVDGCLRRAQTARAHAADFGIATECGLGRRRPETIADLMRLHRTVADRLG